MRELCLELLNKKGVTMDSMVDILIDIQKMYVPNLQRDYCEESILSVIGKRESQHAILTGLEIDRLVEEKQFIEPIQGIIERDEGLYGVDEVLALCIVNVYGSIGSTNFGYLDKVKPSIIGRLNEKKQGVCNTFIDDIVCAIIAAAASRIAHNGN